VSSRKLGGPISARVADTLRVQPGAVSPRAPGSQVRLATDGTLCAGALVRASPNSAGRAKSGPHAQIWQAVPGAPLAQNQETIGV
jgi:hypothetical protein